MLREAIVPMGWCFCPYVAMCISLWPPRAGSIARMLLRVLLVAVGVLASEADAQTCPVDGGGGDTLLIVDGPDRVRTTFDEARLAALPPQERLQRRSVGTSASAPAVEQSLRYGGVLLRDVLERAMPEALKSRAARHLIVEAVATDRYVAVFSWGELFNSELGEQVLVLRTQDGRPIGAEAGPLALRSLADTRTGPRHVRNLCAVVVRALPARP